MREDDMMSSAQTGALLSLAWQLSDKEPTLAQQLCQSALESAPGLAHGWLVLGLILAKQHDSARALGALERAIALDATLLDAHMATADLRMELGDFTGALTALQACFALDPHMRYPNGVRARAMAVRMQKDIAKRSNAASFGTGRRSPAS